MSAALLATVGAALFTAGYVARWIRPLQRLDTWAWDQVHRRARDLRTGPARKRPGWFVAQAVFAVEVAALFVVQPRETARRWRHRNDPPPPKSPPVIITTTARTSTDQEGTRFDY